MQGKRNISFILSYTVFHFLDAENSFGLSLYIELIFWCGGSAGHYWYAHSYFRLSGLRHSSSGMTNMPSFLMRTSSK